MLLRRFGKNDEYIISDYMKYKDNLTEMLECFVRQYPEEDINVITPQERYMREFLEWLSR